ncbi:MAG: amino acid permease, partial [Phycisphaerales bacterium]|nr:amino acid permease [Phycisphaerales bacterium]
MPETKYKKAHKSLGLFAVFALATGTTLSGGFFLLPSFATQLAGPAVILAYLIAGLLLIPPMLSKIELGTAMPRSGGAYYFLDRSLGPMAGTIGGLGICLALLLKTAFALVGMSAYIQLFLPNSGGETLYTLIAVGLVVFFG